MNWKTFPYATLATLVFFSIGYFTGQWGKAWLIWLTIPIFNSLVGQNRSKKMPKPEKAAETEDWSDF